MVGLVPWGIYPDSRATLQYPSLGQGADGGTGITLCPGYPSAVDVI